MQFNQILIGWAMWTINCMLLCAWILERMRGHIYNTYLKYVSDGHIASVISYPVIIHAVGDSNVVLTNKLREYTNAFSDSFFDSDLIMDYSGLAQTLGVKRVFITYYTDVLRHLDINFDTNIQIQYVYTSSSVRRTKKKILFNQVKFET